MEKTIIRNVRDIAGDDRKALEHALGETLRDDQQLIVQVLTVSPAPGGEVAEASDSDGYQDLPEWCDVFAGLSEEDIAEVNAVARCRLQLTREP